MTTFRTTFLVLFLPAFLTTSLATFLATFHATFHATLRTTFLTTFLTTLLRTRFTLPCKCYYFLAEINVVVKVYCKIAMGRACGLSTSSSAPLIPLVSSSLLCMSSLIGWL